MFVDRVAIYVEEGAVEMAALVSAASPTCHGEDRMVAMEVMVAAS